MMSDLLSQYEARLRPRLIDVSGGPAPAPKKFGPDRLPKPFYGLTCIAWIDPESKLFQKLSDLQEKIRREFQGAGLEPIWAYLKPESFHMTVCDVIASCNPIQPRHVDTLTGQVQAAFARIGRPGKVMTQIRGIGLKSTITALVRFDRETELKKVFDIESEIKQSVRQSANFKDLEKDISFRDFAGHISLAYCANNPGENDTGRIHDILRPYKGEDLGEFTFSQLDLTHFIDMNTFVPILTIDLQNGRVTPHNRP
jgi:2'-5' RNA ligase